MRPHRQQPTRLPHPWDSPGKNTGVGCHFLLQCMKVKSEGKSLSRVRLLETPWTAAHQAPPSMGFSRQEYWSGVPLPSPKVGATVQQFSGFQVLYSFLPDPANAASSFSPFMGKWPVVESLCSIGGHLRMRASWSMVCSDFPWLAFGPHMAHGRFSLFAGKEPAKNKHLFLPFWEYHAIPYHGV